MTKSAGQGTESMKKRARDVRERKTRTAPKEGIRLSVQGRAEKKTKGKDKKRQRLNGSDVDKRTVWDALPPEMERAVLEAAGVAGAAALAATCKRLFRRQRAHNGDIFRESVWFLRWVGFPSSSAPDVARRPDSERTGVPVLLFRERVQHPETEDEDGPAAIAPGTTHEQPADAPARPRLWCDAKPGGSPHRLLARVLGAVVVETNRTGSAPSPAGLAADECARPDMMRAARLLASGSDEGRRALLRHAVAQRSSGLLRAVAAVPFSAWEMAPNPWPSGYEEELDALSSSALVHDDAFAREAYPFLTELAIRAETRSRDPDDNLNLYARYLAGLRQLVRALAASPALERREPAPGLAALVADALEVATKAYGARPFSPCMLGRTVLLSPCYRLPAHAVRTHYEAVRRCAIPQRGPAAASSRAVCAAVLRGLTAVLGGENEVPLAWDAAVFLDVFGPEVATPERLAELYAAAWRATLCARRVVSCRCFPDHWRDLARQLDVLERAWPRSRDSLCSAALMWLREARPIHERARACVERRRRRSRDRVGPPALRSDRLPRRPVHAEPAYDADGHPLAAVFDAYWPPRAGCRFCRYW